MGFHGCGRSLRRLRDVELADGLHFNLPARERDRGLGLAFADFLLVGAAHQHPFDIDVIALLQLAGRVFAKSIPSISYVESVFLGLTFAAD